MSRDDPAAEDDTVAESETATEDDAATENDAAGYRGFGTEYSGYDERPHLSQVQRQGSPYTESQVIMTTVKLVSPFVFTYGLFITFHGGGSPGGGFQGGAIMAAVVLMIAFAFGIESTREWLSNPVLVGLSVGGVLVFAGIGLVGLAGGGTFLDYSFLPIPEPMKYGMEGVEILGIAPIVASVLIGLFFLLAAGPADDQTEVSE